MIPGLLTRFTNTGTLTSFKQYETKKLQRSLNFLTGTSKLFALYLSKSLIFGHAESDKFSESLHLGMHITRFHCGTKSETLFPVYSPSSRRHGALVLDEVLRIL